MGNYKEKIQNIIQDKKKISLIIILVLLLGFSVGYYFYLTQENKEEIIKKTLINNKKNVVKENKINEKNNDNDSKDLTKGNNKDNQEKNVEKGLISDINVLVKKINPNKIKLEYNIVKADNNDKEISKLEKIGVITIKDNKQEVKSEKINNLINLPFTILDYIKNNNVLNTLIEKTEYKEGTDLILKDEALSNLEKEIKYTITDYKIKIDKYEANKEIELSSYFVLKKDNEKIKIEGIIKMDLANNSLEFDNVNIVITNNFNTISKILIEKYLITNDKISNIKVSGNISQYELFIDYNEKQKDFFIKRKEKGVLKRTVFKIENVK